MPSIPAFLPNGCQWKGFEVNLLLYLLQLLKLIHAFRSGAICLLILGRGGREGFKEIAEAVIFEAFSSLALLPQTITTFTHKLRQLETKQ